jgi:hypothetical protein
MGFHRIALRFPSRPSFCEELDLGKPERQRATQNYSAGLITGTQLLNGLCRSNSLWFLLRFAQVTTMAQKIAMAITSKVSVIYHPLNIRSAPPQGKPIS